MASMEAEIRRLRVQLANKQGEVSEPEIRLIRETQTAEPGVTELAVPSEIFMERKVKFWPKIAEYYHYAQAKLGRELMFDVFVNNVIDEHFKDCMRLDLRVTIMPPKKKE